MTDLEKECEHVLGNALEWFTKGRGALSAIEVQRQIEILLAKMDSIQFDETGKERQPA